MIRKNIVFIRNKKNRPLILDGAIGSLLQSYELFSNDELWSSSVNLTNPKALTNIYKNYIAAGAEIITTNTFRTNPAALDKLNMNIDKNKLVRDSVNLARNGNLQNANLRVPNGSIMVPSILLPSMVVNRDNIKMTVIEDDYLIEQEIFDTTVNKEN